MSNRDWPFGTPPFGLFWSNLGTRDLKTYLRIYSGHFEICHFLVIPVLFTKWVVSENQSILDKGAIDSLLLV